MAAVEDGRPIGFAQVETHDGGSEVAQVFVHPDRRGEGLGGALTARAVRVGADAAPRVWICAERDNHPRRLYERLGFRPVVETGDRHPAPEAVVRKQDQQGLAVAPDRLVAALEQPSNPG